MSFSATTSAHPTISGHRPLVGVSTKMYFTHARTTSFVSSVLSLLSSKAPGSTTLLREKVDAFIIPDFVSVPATIAAISTSGTAGNIVVGAQDCAAATEDFGAYTGEVSAAVLREVGCGIVEVGHAERRRLFGETDDVTAAKAAAAARNEMAPLVCVGEVAAPLSPVLNSSSAEEVLSQVRAVLEKLDGAADVVLAYEPVWAIGAPQPASADHVKGVVRLVRESEVVMGRSGRTRIVYGGAAGPGLWKRLEGEVDGLFLGRFAHDPEQFVKLLYEVAGMSYEG
ncbi:Triosephosphate isomerase-like protein [Corynascus similis CBS 632.67]